MFNCAQCITFNSLKTVLTKTKTGANKPAQDGIHLLDRSLKSKIPKPMYCLHQNWFLNSGYQILNRGRTGVTKIFQCYIGLYHLILHMHGSIANIDLRCPRKRNGEKVFQTLLDNFSNHYLEWLKSVVFEKDDNRYAITHVEVCKQIISLSYRMIFI